MRKKLLLGILSIASLICVVAVAFSASYAWLTPGKPIAFDADGTAVAGYFGGGTGTEDEPYLLMTPKHVYNLAWLQYMGTFNETVTENGEVSLKQQYYFELADDIDMAGDPQWQIIPPIGTMEHPFVGNFDGNNHTISNAIIANTIQTGQQRPPAVENLLNGEIIGFFGVIGEYDDQKLVSTDQLGKLKVSNLVLKNITVRTSTEASLAGLFAGFVNGTIDNIKVNSGGFESSKDNKTPYSVVWKEGFVLNEGGAYSLYTLIGDYYTTRVKWDGITGPTTDSGQGPGFGGSIDMLSLAKRVQYMMAAGNHSPQTGYYSPTSTVTDKYHIVGYTGTNHTFDYDTNGDMFCFSTETYLPLNINLDNIEETYYKALTAEEILSTNTGYLVGKYDLDRYGSPSMNSPTLRIRPVGQLCYSLQGSGSNAIVSSLPYTDSALQILTRDGNGNYYVIGDSHNGLTSTDKPYTKYTESSKKKATVQTYGELGLTQYEGTNNVRGKLQELLEGNSTFSVLQLAKDVPDANSMISGLSVKLGDQTVTSLAQGTVHFYVQNSGVMTMVAATLGTQHNNIVTSGVQYLPRLYKVDRTGQTVLFEAVDTIWVNEDGDVSYEEKSGYDKVYDYNAVGHLAGYSGDDNDEYWNSLFYFEIPVQKGEYVLGGNGQNQTYLLYLDIGGNAGSTPGPGENPDLDESQGATISGVYFATEGANSTNIEKYFKVSKSDAGSAGSISFMANINTSDITQSSSNMTSTPVAKQEETSSAGGS